MAHNLGLLAEAYREIVKALTAYHSALAKGVESASKVRHETEVEWTDKAGQSFSRMVEGFEKDLTQFAQGINDIHQNFNEAAENAAALENFGSELFNQHF